MKGLLVTRRPRICFVSMEVYPNLMPGAAKEAGGAGFQLLELARGLQNKDYHVSFVVGDYGQSFREDIEGFTLFRANKVAYDRSVVRGLANLGRLFKAMRAARADHYVLRSTRFLSFFVMLYARLLGARYTFMVASRPHCLRGELESISPVIQRLYEWSLKGAHRVSVQTKEQQDLIRETFGLESPIVPNGIAVPQFEGPRLEVPYDFSWIASFKIAKRADQLIEIARLLPERRFLVVGGPGQDKEYSRRLTETLESLPNVTYEGFVTPDIVGDCYARSRIFLNTSDWEGFPNGYLYAWSRGIPACSLSIDPDGVVTQKELGIVEPDLNKLAEGLDRLLDESERYSEMARRCHDHVLENHSVDNLVDLFLSALPE